MVLELFPLAGPCSACASMASPVDMLDALTAEAPVLLMPAVFEAAAMALAPGV
jgi:hypothetical protein